MCPLTKRFLWVYFNGKSHPPADGPEQNHLVRAFVCGYQPGGEALIPLDGAEEWGAAGSSCGDTPCHTRAEVVIHADGQGDAFLSRPHNGVHLSGAAIPWVVHAV